MTIKTNRARRLADIGRCPRTCDALLAAMPDTLTDALTARQIAAVLDLLRAQFLAGHNAGWTDRAEQQAARIASLEAALDGFCAIAEDDDVYPLHTEAGRAALATGY